MSDTLPGPADLLTVERFEAWLRGLPADAPVSRTPDCWRCPVAAYLASQGASSPVVGTTYVSMDNDGYLPMPRWAQRFVDRVDAQAYVETPDSWQTITAARALAILQECR